MLKLIKRLFCRHDYELVAKCCNSDNRSWKYQMMPYLEPAPGWGIGIRSCKKCGHQEWYAQDIEDEAIQSLKDHYVPKDYHND